MPTSFRPLLLALATPVVMCACNTGRAAVATTQAPDTALIMRDVRHLASDALEGRGTGTAGNDSAAAYLARRFQALKLRAPFPAGEARCAEASAGTRAACAAGFAQPFVARSVAMQHQANGGGAAGLPTQNVAALLPGTDPALRDQYVVIGAHFDHLGRTGFNALDPDAANAIRNGADDNASGTAAVLELARVLARHPTRRSILFVLFSGEELGLLGSDHITKNSPVPLASVQAMLNFDMVGRLVDDRLAVLGVESAKEWRGIVDSANVAPPLRVAASGDGFGASDHQSYYLRDIPVLHFFTNVHEDYHRASDDPEKINGAGIAKVVAYAERITRAVADRDARLTLVKVAAPAPTASARAGTQAYLGSIPDMAAAEVKGVRLSGVRTGSPADSAGLLEGDVIVELDGKAIGDLYAYTDALYARKPGDTITIVVLRGGERVTVKARLGRRGS